MKLSVLVFIVDVRGSETGVFEFRFVGSSVG